MTTPPVTNGGGSVEPTLEWVASCLLSGGGGGAVRRPVVDDDDLGKSLGTRKDKPLVACCVNGLAMMVW